MSADNNSTTRVVRAIKARALREAAAAWDAADKDRTIQQFADEFYKPGNNLCVLWLNHRADQIEREIGQGPR